MTFEGRRLKNEGHPIPDNDGRKNREGDGKEGERTAYAK
jgi:hypothetical protein